MPNARKKGLKLAAAFVTEEVDAALVALAQKRGYKDKASLIRVLIDTALEGASTLEEDATPYTATPRPKSKRPPSKRTRRAEE